MTGHPPSWADLIPKLEAELRERENEVAAPREHEDVWLVAERILRKQGYLLRRSHSLPEEDIEDTIQEVLVKLQSLATIRKIKASGSPSGYIAVMIRNAATDVIRRKKRELGYEVNEHRLQENRSFKSPQDDKTSGLLQALQALTGEERALLEMRFWQDMSIGEISTRLGISYSAAAVRVFRTLKRLREILAGRP